MVEPDSRRRFWFFGPAASKTHHPKPEPLPPQTLLASSRSARTAVNSADLGSPPPSHKPAVSAITYSPDIGSIPFADVLPLPNSPARARGVPQVGIPSVDRLLLDPAALETLESAHRLLRLARISRGGVQARHLASQHEQREATFCLHLSNERLAITASQVSAHDMGIGRLRALIEAAGLSVHAIEEMDAELIEEATVDADDHESSASSDGTDHAK